MFTALWNSPPFSCNLEGILILPQVLRITTVEKLKELMVIFPFNIQLLLEDVRVLDSLAQAI